MATKKETIKLNNGTMAEAQMPVIVSASRSTDIPAFYADWFFSRLKKGYSSWRNPFNGVPMYVSYQKTRFIVFWSKNPQPLIKHLDYLKERNINCYIQYSLNDYEKEGLEKRVPNLDYRINTFKELVNKLGKGHVIWRFDPLVLADNITVDDLLRKVENIGDQLKGFTEKLVFSFADIETYPKVKNNLIRNNVNYREWTEPDMREFASRLVELNKKWNYELATCGEGTKFDGVQKNSCVDENLMIRFAYKDKELMDFLKVEVKTKQASIFEPFVLPEGAIDIDSSHYAIKKKNNKDKGQREACGCIISKDIGQYNTCIHQCEYCYANTSKEVAMKNYQLHKNNPESETITGN